MRSSVKNLWIMAILASFTAGSWYFYWHILDYRNQDEIHLLQSDYQGPVYIVFNSPQGEPPEYETGKRVYRIPANGILRTQFRPQSGVVRNMSYYYVSSIGKRTVIGFKSRGVTNDYSIVFISHIETGSGGCQPDGDGGYINFPYRSYLVSDDKHEDLHYAKLNNEDKSPQELICDPNIY
jgi:hypothetical protein